MTHVESPSEFWVILDEEKPKLATLNKFLQKHCESHTENPTMNEGVILLTAIVLLDSCSNS